VRLRIGGQLVGLGVSDGLVMNERMGGGGRRRLGRDFVAEDVVGGELGALNLSLNQEGGSDSGRSLNQEGGSDSGRSLNQEGGSDSGWATPTPRPATRRDVGDPMTFHMKVEHGQVGILRHLWPRRQSRRCSSASRAAGQSGTLPQQQS
jgi:hypothetical protein